MIASEPEVHYEPDVVIVDDQASNRAIFAKLVTSVDRHVRVHEFSSPLAALEWLAGRSADLIITDYKMPGLNGSEFVGRLQAEPLWADIPAVVITAYGERELRLAALEAGATDFLHSPIDPHEFSTRVRNLLRMSAQQRMLRGRATELAINLDASEAARERVIRDSKELLTRVIDTIPTMISAADRDGQCVFVNAYHARLAGVTAESLVGRDATEPFGEEHQARSRALDKMVFQTGESLAAFEEEIADRSLSRRIMLTSKTPLYDSAGQILSVLTTSLDITDRKKAEEDLVFMARHDQLTRLPNRSFFYEQLQAAFGRSRRGDTGFTILFVDLDRFKLVNDGMGHQMGDLLLTVVAQRLQQVVGPDGIAARLGGDEFGVLHWRITGRNEASELAERIVNALREPYLLDGQIIESSASIGVALHPRGGHSPDELVRSADLAMYRAKLGGRNGYRFFGGDTQDELADWNDMERDLHAAIARNQLVLHYQPQVNTDTGQIVGVEALLRWSRPGWGVLSPAAFLPVAETTGLITLITEWTLNEACRQAVKWQTDYARAIGISVNMSTKSVNDPGFVDMVKAALDLSGLDADLLTLEVPQDLAVQVARRADSNLAVVLDLGVHICIDNFGIDDFHPVRQTDGDLFDRVKIDQSLVHALSQREGAIERIRSMLRMARARRLQVSAIGVESQRQMTLLRDEDCLIMQGYLIGRPCPASKFDELAHGPLMFGEPSRVGA
jgi:diguanylate cyclase (GGDEF)-like protein/PAS domain S-box-containing protein